MSTSVSAPKPVRRAPSLTASILGTIKTGFKNTNPINLIRRRRRADGTSDASSGEVSFDVKTRYIAFPKGNMDDAPKAIFNRLCNDVTEIRDSIGRHLVNETDAFKALCNDIVKSLNSLMDGGYHKDAISSFFKEPILLQFKAYLENLAAENQTSTRAVEKLVTILMLIRDVALVLTEMGNLNPSELSAANAFVLPLMALFGQKDRSEELLRLQNEIDTSILTQKEKDKSAFLTLFRIIVTKDIPLFQKVLLEQDFVILEDLKPTKKMARIVVLVDTMLIMKHSKSKKNRPYKLLVRPLDLEEVMIMDYAPLATVVDSKKMVEFKVNNSNLQFIMIMNAVDSKQKNTFFEVILDAKKSLSHARGTVDNTELTVRRAAGQSKRTHKEPVIDAKRDLVKETPKIQTRVDAQPADAPVLLNPSDELFISELKKSHEFDVTSKSWVSLAPCRVRLSRTSNNRFLLDVNFARNGAIFGTCLLNQEARIDKVPDRKKHVMVLLNVEGKPVKCLLQLQTEELANELIEKVAKLSKQDSACGLEEALAEMDKQEAEKQITTESQQDQNDQTQPEAIELKEPAAEEAAVKNVEQSNHAGSSVPVVPVAEAAEMQDAETPQGEDETSQNVVPRQVEAPSQDHVEAVEKADPVISEMTDVHVHEHVETEARPEAPTEPSPQTESIECIPNDETQHLEERQVEDLVQVCQHNVQNEEEENKKHEDAHAGPNLAEKFQEDLKETPLPEVENHNKCPSSVAVQASESEPAEPTGTFEETPETPESQNSKQVESEREISNPIEMSGSGSSELGQAENILADENAQIGSVTLEPNTEIKPVEQDVEKPESECVEAEPCDMEPTTVEQEPNQDPINEVAAESPSTEVTLEGEDVAQEAVEVDKPENHNANKNIDLKLPSSMTETEAYVLELAAKYAGVIPSAIRLNGSRKKVPNEKDTKSQDEVDELGKALTSKVDQMKSTIKHLYNMLEFMTELHKASAQAA